MTKRFDKICKHCGRNIIPDIPLHTWQTKRQNKFGSFNSCGRTGSLPRHEPFTNLEYIAYKYGLL